MATFLFILAALAALASVTGLMVALAAILFDGPDAVAAKGLFAFFLGVVVACVLLFTAILMGGDQPTIISGHCYQAYTHGSYVPIYVNTGKTTVIIPTYAEGIDLVEMECPR